MIQTQSSFCRDMDLQDQFLRLGVALGLGLLVGMQRERSGSALAGFRTFPLVTVTGFFCALLNAQAGGWLIAAGLLALVGLELIAGQTAKPKMAEPPGLTTLAALLLMFLVGAYLVKGDISLALVVSAGVAVLLQMKGSMHGFVNRLTDDEYQAITRFVLLALVVLPVLPDKAYGPFGVLNPHEIWLMVVLIVGISLGGYVSFKLFGNRGGAVVAGLLGGVISSTATTLSYARHVKQTPALANLAVVVVTIASGMVFLRLALEIAVVAPGFLATAAPPMGLMAGLMALLCLIAWGVGKPGTAPLPQEGDLAQMNAALAFGLLYAVIVFSVAATKEHFGNEGLYVVAVLSGLTDVDAITLSTSNLVRSGKLTPTTGWKLILVAALSNLGFKGLLAMLVGSRVLALRLLPLFGAAIAGGLGILFFW